MALAQFEGTLVLVSHDRHLLRATTDQFMIVAEGNLQPFDGDLEDYRDWLFKTKLAEKSAAPVNDAKTALEQPTLDRREQRRLEAEERQRLGALRKPIESRIKKLEELMAKLQEKKVSVDARLAEPVIYDAANKEELKELLLVQADCAKQLEQAETEWLEQQEALERVA